MADLLPDVEITQVVRRISESGITSDQTDRKRRMRLLFVDDEPHVLSGLRRMLRGFRSAWDMRFCVSGREALDSLTELSADVVVSDMRMPEMDGLALLELVAERWPRTIRFILSGNAKRGEVIRTVGPVHQYLSKPCDPEVLQETLRRTLHLKASIDRVAETDLVTSFQNLPVLPSIYLELDQALRDDQSSLEIVAEIISRDPSLTLRLLKTVNSAYFGLKREVVRVEDAVSVLGMEAVQSLAIGHRTFSDAHVHQALEPTIERIWGHSQRVAALARHIGRSLGLQRDEVEAAYFAALMHDVGILLCLAQIPQEYLRLLKAVGLHRAPLSLSERTVLGATHGQIGGYLLGLWGIGDHIVDAVIRHHEPISTEGPPDIQRVVHLADLIDGQRTGGISPDIGLHEHPDDKESTDEILGPWRDLIESEEFPR